MTHHELYFELAKMDDTAFHEFVERLGGGYRFRVDVEDAFVQNPQFERRLCQLLGTMTQDEKLVNAAEVSADASKTSAIAAKESAESSRRSVIIAWIGIVISIIALAVTIFKD